MQLAFPRRRSASAPQLSILQRWKRAEVVPLRAEDPDANDERYYELGCVPPRLRERDAG